jgi:hypothetical protein
MTSDTSPRHVSPLRARMIEDMTVRGFKEDTRRDYVRTPSSASRPTPRQRRTGVSSNCTKTQSRMQPPSINSAVSASNSPLELFLGLYQGPRAVCFARIVPSPPTGRAMPKESDHVGDTYEGSG